MIRIIRTDEGSFEDRFRRIMQRGNVFDKKILSVVKTIVDDVAARKDKALFAYTRKFDGCALNGDTVMVSPEEMKQALSRVSREDMLVLKTAARRVEKFHRKQKMHSWSYRDEEGIELGQRILPMDRIGIYAPGGLASYPSTVIMAAVPARIAGVPEIILVTPPSPDGEINPLVVAAANLSGVTRIFKIGGAQAIAALAYGTESIPAVDKIVGPGNAYVAAAKKMVYGQVAIDMIAGPSEVVVIADKTAPPDHVAADLLAQAEHDAMASAVLLTPDEALAQSVLLEIKRQLKTLERKAIATRSLNAFGMIVLTRDMDEAVQISNRFAPEHLELIVKKPKEMLDKIRHAGAVFLGYSTPESIGDYIAGPNHILPTGGTARFASPLGVYDFIKRSSVLYFSGKALQKYGAQTVQFTKMEGLHAHGRSVSMRMQGKKP
jgi:histidinol dehydrogenase